MPSSLRSETWNNYLIYCMWLGALLVYQLGRIGWPCYVQCWEGVPLGRAKKKQKPIGSYSYNESCYLHTLCNGFSLRKHLPKLCWLPLSVFNFQSNLKKQNLKLHPFSYEGLFRKCSNRLCQTYFRKQVSSINYKLLWALANPWTVKAHQAPLVHPEFLGRRYWVELPFPFRIEKKEGSLLWPQDGTGSPPIAWRFLPVWVWGAYKGFEKPLYKI